MCACTYGCRYEQIRPKYPPLTAGVMPLFWDLPTVELCMRIVRVAPRPPGTVCVGVADHSRSPGQVSAHMRLRIPSRLQLWQSMTRCRWWLGTDKKHGHRRSGLGKEAWYATLPRYRAHGYDTKTEWSVCMSRPFTYVVTLMP